MPPKIPPKKPTIAQQPPKEQARVLFSYTAENDDELTIKEGDIINIIDKEIEDKGWMKGELNGKVGVFPDNFIALISPSVPAGKPISFKSVSNSFHSSNNSLNNGNGTADDSPPKLPLKKPPAETKLSKISSKFGDSIRDMIISKSNNSLNETPIAAQKSGPLFLQKQQQPNSDDLIKPAAVHPASHPAAHPAAASVTNSSAPSLPLKKSKLFAPVKPPKDEDSAGETTANDSSLSKSADLSGDLSSSMSSFIDEHNSSIKLTHLTKHRVSQGPPRRPPSIIQINSKDDESFDGLDSSGPLSDKNDSTDNLDLDLAGVPKQTPAKPAGDSTPLNRQSFKSTNNSQTNEMSSSMSNSISNSMSGPLSGPMSGPMSTPTTKATTPTNQPPWMVELKKTQAEKKNEVGKMKKNFSFDEGTGSLLTSVAPSPVIAAAAATTTTSQPTRHESNSFNGASPNSSKKALQMPNSPTKPVAPSGAITSHRMSGDYSQRFKDFLQSNNTPATNSLSRHSSVNNNHHSFNSARTLSTDSLTNTADKEQSSMLGFGNLASPFASVVKPVKAAKPTTAPKFMAGSPTATSASSVGNLLSSNLNNNNNHNSHQTAAGKESVSRKEFDELQKKVNDLTEIIETQKQTYKGLMKDLINDIAEEKKKVANLTIEVDRLRKLTTTV